MQAYQSMTKPLLQNHHEKIIEALKILKKATSEEVAIYLKWDDKNRAARRMSELERNQIIYKPGEVKKTKYGRNAYVYMLTKQEPEVKPTYTARLLFDHYD